MTLSRKKIVLFAVAGVALVVGVLVAFLAPSSHTSTSSGGSHVILLALLPIYASLIPIYAARRRRNKSNDG